MLRCSSCKSEKEESSFWKNKTSKTGYQNVCITCMKAMNVRPSLEKERESARKYREKNKEIVLERSRKWRRNNLKYDAFRAMTYRATKRKQTPSWANLEKIKEIYLGCPDGFHVDHIVPLRGTTVSGLHVETNLQYLPEKENLAKRNKYYG